MKSALATDVARGEFREGSRVRLTDYAHEWVRTYEGRTSRGIRAETVREYGRDLELHVLPTLGRLRLGEIEQRDLKGLTRDLAAKGLSQGTLRVVMAPVRALFATAVEEGLLRTNPAAGLRITVGGQTTMPEDRRRALNEDELLRLIENTPEQWRLLVRFTAQTGLRVSELIALTWRDIDLDGRRVMVRRRLYRGEIDAPKSSYGVRQVPISARLAADLRSAGAGTDGDPVFPNAQGRPLRPEFVLRSIVRPAAVAAGVPWAGVHTLRHTCASILFRSGWNAKQVQMVLGHHSPAFTLATYVHLVPDDLPEPHFRHDDEAYTSIG